MARLSLNREILRLSVPAIVSNITVPLLGLCDTAISGHLGSEAYIGAIAVGSMMMNALFWLFGFLRMGTTGLTAQAYGAGRTDACYSTLYQALAVGITAGVCMICLQIPLFALLRVVMGADPQVEALARLYFSICIWAAPAQLSTMCILGWFLGMQNTTRPMAISVTVNAVNICLSLALVIFCGMGFKGVAIGTLAANWLGLGLAVGLLVRFKGMRLPRLRLRQVCDGRALGRFFRVNTDIFFRSACIMGVTMAVTAIGARIGSVELAANAVLMQFFLFFSYFMDGLAFTGEALAGRYAGAGDAVMLRRSTGRLLQWSGVLAAVFFVIYLFGYKQIIGLITNEAAVVQCACDMWGWIVLMPPLTVAAFIFDGFYIGVTATRRMLWTTLASAAVFFAIALPRLSNEHLWLAFLSYLLCRGLSLAAMWPRVRRLSLHP